MARYTALFDACVLYPGQIRDLLISLAQTDTFTAKWSDEINEEWVSALVGAGKDRQTLLSTCKLMAAAVPDAIVTGYDHLVTGLILPDERDRHVLAAAISGRCDVIITNNLKDFPLTILSQYGIEVQTPDVFVSNLYDLHPDVVDYTVRTILARLTKPPISQDQYLTRLDLNKMALTASLLAQNWQIIRTKSTAEVVSIDDARRKK